ncbi:hypothetical protein AYI68_g1284 [Smittium mucronatum]|uniref:Splicing factor 3A subunit 1 n=1 Tax=Smittium mucronatum TaxID=133383 RepID=A0A1R0H5R7_9FUNG|nr:hypothetical protein AYI68_g1284 [Smittium mucronatum]
MPQFELNTIESTQDLQPSVESFVTIPDTIKIPEDPETRKRIEDTARLVVSKKEQFSRTEMKLRVSKSVLDHKIYSFLSNSHEFNHYYKFYRDSINSGKTVIDPKPINE